MNDILLYIRDYTLRTDIDARISFCKAFRVPFRRIGGDKRLEKRLSTRRIFKCFLCGGMIHSYLFCDEGRILTKETRHACGTCFANFSNRRYRLLYVSARCIKDTERFSLPFYVPVGFSKERIPYEMYVESHVLKGVDIEHFEDVKRRPIYFIEYK